MKENEEVQERDDGYISYKDDDLAFSEHLPLFC